MGDALVSKDGESLYYLARFERGMNLWTTNLRTRETKMLITLNSTSGSMEWDKEQKNIFLLADGGISKIDPATSKRDMVPINGEMFVDGGAERAAMFEHVWTRTRDTFYSAGYHGADWNSLKPMYAKFLPHLANNYEFAEMLAEMLGELNISHSGATYTASTPNDDATASLGVFYAQSYAGTGVKIEEVIKDGPLDRSGLSVRAGMVIESIDGTNAIVTASAPTDSPLNFRKPIAQLVPRIPPVSPRIVLSLKTKPKTRNPENPIVCSTACSRIRSCTDMIVVVATSASTRPTQA